MIKDSLGTPIEPEQIVIYNHSGTLAVGKVLRVVHKERPQYYTCKMIFAGFIEITHINPQGSALGRSKSPKNGISRVRNPDSIIVITDKEGKYINVSSAR